MANKMKEQGIEMANKAKEQALEAADKAKEKAMEMADKAKEQAMEAANKAKEQAMEAANKAKEQGTTFVLMRSIPRGSFSQIYEILDISLKVFRDGKFRASICIYFGSKIFVYKNLQPHVTLARCSKFNIIYLHRSL